MNEDKTLIRIWFEKRFNKTPEKGQDYFEEWVFRFAKGEDYAKNCMDSESLRVWKEQKQIYFENADEEFLRENENGI